MKQILLFGFVILFTFGCKSEQAQSSAKTHNKSVKSKIDTAEEKVEVDLDDIASMIAGNYEGMGNYASNTGNDDIDFKNISVKKKDKNTVIISSPDDVFPSFEVTDLIDQFTTIIGKTGEEKGFLTYNKSSKKIKGIIKSFDETSKVLRFGMP